MAVAPTGRSHGYAHVALPPLCRLGSRRRVWRSFLVVPVLRWWLTTSPAASPLTRTHGGLRCHNMQRRACFCREGALSRHSEKQWRLRGSGLRLCPKRAVLLPNSECECVFGSSRVLRGPQVLADGKVRGGAAAGGGEDPEVPPPQPRRGEQGQVRGTLATGRRGQCWEHRAVPELRGSARWGCRSPSGLALWLLPGWGRGRSPRQAWRRPPRGPSCHPRVGLLWPSSSQASPSGKSVAPPPSEDGAGCLLPR